MKVKGLIFDFDYTLGDSTDGIVQSIHYALNQMGHPSPSVEEIRYTIGLSLEDTYIQLTKDENAQNCQRFHTYFVEKANKVMVDHTTLFPAAISTLELLRQRGFTTGIVTTKHHDTIDQILNRHGKEHLMDYIIGCEDVSAVKPDPEGLFKMFDLMQLDKRDLLYIGDSLTDAKAAQKAGVNFIPVTTGTTTKEDFRSYPFVHMMDSMDELLMLVES